VSPDPKAILPSRVKARKVVRPNFVGLPHETLAEAGIKMTKVQIRNGKRWIEETIRKTSTDRALPINNLKWKILGNEMLSLVFSVEKVRYFEIFSEDDLSDLPKSPDIKTKVEKRLRDLMKAIRSEAKKR